MTFDKDDEKAYVTRAELNQYVKELFELEMKEVRKKIQDNVNNLSWIEEKLERTDKSFARIDKSINEAHAKIENLKQGIKVLAGQQETLDKKVEELKKLLEGATTAGKAVQASPGRSSAKKEPTKRTKADAAAPAVARPKISKEYEFLKDYYNISDKEFSEKYHCQNAALGNFSQLRTGAANTAEFRNEQGNFIVIRHNNSEYLLPEKSFLESGRGLAPIGMVFEIDSRLMNISLQAGNILVPATVKRKDADTWICVKKGVVV